MNLSELLPNNSPNWSFDTNYIYWKKYQRIPLLSIRDDKVVVFLDNRLPKPVLNLVEMLLSKGIEFYFLPPKFSHPPILICEESYGEVIRHYLLSYTTKDFFFGFRKIEFDLIENLTNWMNSRGCFSIFKDILSDIKKDVLRKQYDWYSKKEYHSFSEEIRHEFETLYRQIQINQIFGK